MITNAEDLQSYAAAWNAHDVERVLAYFVEDCEYESVASGVNHVGKSDLRGFMERAFASIEDFNINITSAHTAPGWSVSEWIMSGRSPSGVDFAVRGVSVGLLDPNGLIRKITDYWNPAELQTSQQRQASG